MNEPIPADGPGLPGATLKFPTCEDAIHVLTHLYLELRLPPSLALRAARADCKATSPCVEAEEVELLQARTPTVEDGESAETTEAEPAAIAPVQPVLPVENAMAAASPAPLGLIIAAFAAVYIIWGSTYLAISMAIQTVPPFLMAGVRFLTAGLCLFGVLKLRGIPAPRGVQWKSALFVGVLLLVAGNGGVTWAEQRVPSGLTALLIATVPLWMIILDWVRPGGSGRPRPAVFGGLAMGFAGVALIVLAKDHTGHNVVDPVGVAVLLAASLCWAVGSVFSKGLPQAPHPLMAVSAQMMCGGALMLLGGLASGEGANFHPSAISRTSLLALLYLIFIGALVGFTAYVWLLRVSTPARVSTYAYVNPLIAVVLGAFIGHEAVSGGILLAGSLIIGAVVLITTSKASAAKRAG